jgi:hypothetical protein
MSTDSSSDRQKRRRPSNLVGREADVRTQDSPKSVRFALANGLLQRIELDLVVLRKEG